MCIIALLWSCALGSCHGLDNPGGDPLPLIPTDAVAVGVVPSLEDTRTAGVSRLAAVTGASGLLDLVHARAGIDLLNANGFRQAGLEANGPLALFKWRDVLATAVGVVHSGRFDALMEDRISRGLGGELVQRPGEHLERVATLPESRGGGALAWGTTHTHVGLLVWAPGVDIAAERWWTLSSGSGGYMQRAEVKAIHAQVPAEALMWAVVEASPALPSELGPLGAALSSMLQGLSRWSGAVVSEEHGLSIRVLGQWVGKGGLPADWLHGQPLSSSITRRLPQSTTAFGRLRLNPARLRLIPGWLRDRFLPPRIPGPLGEILPSTASLLDHLGDEIGVGLLGLDESATLETLSKGLTNPRLLAQLLHVAVAARLASADAGPLLIQQMKTSLEDSGWKTAEVSAGGWRGLSVQSGRPLQIWNILTTDDVLLVTSGAGEVERLRALAEGRALPLMGEQKTPPEGQVAHVRLGFTRLTRELADKGVPPYFLEMLNDLRQLDLWVDLATDRLGLRLELQL